MKKLMLLLFVVLSLIVVKSSAQASAAPTATTAFSIADSASFKGKYKFEDMPFEYIEVSVSEGKLYFVGGEYNGFLEPKTDKKDVFDVNGVAVFTFGRNAQNKIETLKVEYEGQTYEGKKEEKKAS